MCACPQDKSQKAKIYKMKKNKNNNVSSLRDSCIYIGSGARCGWAQKRIPPATSSHAKEEESEWRTRVTHRQLRIKWHVYKNLRMARRFYKQKVVVEGGRVLFGSLGRVNRLCSSHSHWFMETLAM